MDVCVLVDGSLQILVENIGDFTAPASILSVGAFLGTGTFYEEYEIPLLTPGQSHTVEVPDPPFCDEISCRNFSIQADQHEEVDESDEDNNLLQFLFQGAECPTSSGG